MFISDNWKDYEILDTGFGRKLERWGSYILDRPDPQVIWKKQLSPEKWEEADGIYHRSNSGGGSWKIKSLPEIWQIEYKFSKGSPLTFNLKPFSFKHTGLFPEQAVNWDWMHSLILNSNRNLKVLNLFAYTGGATLACAHAGAEVTHVDASKGMVTWAKENSVSSGLSGRPIRWLVDDCVKFVQREIRRENKYDAIIMDPPSYGRGPKGETWKTEDMLYDLIELCAKLMSDNPAFFLVNSYTTGLSASAVSYVLKLFFKDADITSDEIGLPVKSSKGLYLPCGASSRVSYI